MVKLIVRVIMTAVRYVSAIISIGVGVALAFAAVQSMYSSLGLGDNPGAAIAAGVGGMFLLGTYLLLRRNIRASDVRARRLSSAYITDEPE
jgi:hypothetical protein